ncbi:DUF4118 domain-containing protein [uncultured Thomasclavelia sp.]|uniref:DUF4118 domain-containing protein n=1 Tax=uncultured Thomasclavelia sp. TaxID=3025759 RepID=UPI0025F23524|nr:DUF4118 domain-containing protein [uncultured Thomasclavelia sp.]
MDIKQEHVLLCLSPSASNPDVIKMAATVARDSQAIFTALYVETPDSTKMSKKDQEQLRYNVNLSRQLGANIETAFGEDIVYQINEFCKNFNVTKVFIGYSQRKKWHLYDNSLDKRIIETLQDLDVNVVYHQDPLKQEPKRKNKFIFKISDLLISSLVLLLATLIGILFHHLGFSEANTITIYILGVLIIAVTTTNRVYSLVSSILSVVIFNFMFTNPRFTFAAYDSGYPVTFGIMLIAAFITSTLAIRINQQAKQSAQYAYRTKVLLETNRLLQKEKSIAGIKQTTARQITKLLNMPVIICQVNTDDQIYYECFGEADIDEFKQDSEVMKILTAFKQRKSLQDTNYYLPLVSANDIYGVVIIVAGGNIIDAFENNLILSIVGESALALEKELFNKKREEAAIEAKNERLRADLLRSISHDLRTPLTSISGNASVLMNDGNNLSEEKKYDLYQVIYDDSLWLINLVENLLSVTRLENGKMNLHLETELIDEIINEALNHISRRIEQHHLVVVNHEEFILAKVDARLIIQVIINIVDNAIKYTPKGSTIEIETIKHDHLVEVQIRDNGPGIKDEDKEKLFEMFYTVKHNISDSRRGLGLGLALCKAIINAHNGTISVKDNHPCGTIFSFSIPIEEVEIHE